MTATHSDRMTPYKGVELVVVPVAAGAHIPAGTIVCINTKGFAVPGQTAGGLKYVGMADEAADNTGGADGAVKVRVRRGKAFCWANDTADPVAQASLGRVCFVVDNQTVAATDGGGKRSPAGDVVEIDADGVWVC